MIKFILKTITSERDINGNCYHVGIVTRTSDRATFSTQVGGDSNLRHYARKAGLEFDDYYDVQCVVSKRDFKRITKDIPYREPELETFFKGGNKMMTEFELTVNTILGVIKRQKLNGCINSNGGAVYVTGHTNPDGSYHNWIMYKPNTTEVSKCNK